MYHEFTPVYLFASNMSSILSWELVLGY